MPSRKKAKGKARKAAKAVREAKEAEAAKAKEEENQAMLTEATNQLQSLTMGDLLQRHGLRRTANQTCQHGIPSELSPDDRKIYDDFINDFSKTFLSRGDMKVWASLTAAYKATQTEKYAEVYASKLETVVSILLSNGTQRILNGDNHLAEVDAFLANYFENTNWAVLLKQETVPTNNWGAVGVEVASGDIHTLVKFYRKRIPCSCLDKKYKEVKSVTRMGCCFNPNCSQPGRRVERSTMFSCSRCGKANYCSVECQKANWKAHKECCDMSVLVNSL